MEGMIIIMARYKVSYRVLRQQGEDMKNVAKMVDGYVDRVGKIRGQLGSDNMLSEIRGNLQRLGVQLGESRAILNTAGELLVRNVESYNGVEVKQVKKVDAMKAHNRDFYKKPIVVASVGGGSAGAGAAGSAGAAGAAGAGAAGAAGSAGVVGDTTTTTVNYTDNSVNVTYNAEPVAASPASGGMADIASQGGVSQPGPIPGPSQPVTTAAQPIGAQPSTPGSGAPTPQSVLRESAAAAKGSVGVGAVAGVAAGAATAGSILGGAEAKKRRDAQKPSDEPVTVSSDGYDPEAELEKALQKVRDFDAEM